MSTPVVTRTGALCMQVCVPKEWTDEQVVAFAESANPCGTAAGWQLRTDPKLLDGDKPRVPCADAPDEKIHVTLDA